ncbi:MAG: response regulator [Desulfocurvibacter africanus]
MSTGSVMGYASDLYRIISDTLDDGVSIHDPKSGSVLDVNPAMIRMFGYDREEALGLTVERFCLESEPFSRADALAWISKALTMGPQCFEWRTRDKNGRDFWVEVRLNSFSLAGQTRLLTIVRDIDALKTSELPATGPTCSEGDLRGLQRKAGVGVLAGAIAHGLNNSLTPILGYASEARSMASDPAMAFCLDETLKACGKARDLVSSLLTLSRPNESRREAMHLWPALESCLQAARALLPPGVSLDVQGDASHAMAVVSTGEVHEIILSLCAIAAQALPGKRGNLALRLEQAFPASGCRVSVLAVAHNGEAAGEPDMRGSVMASVQSLAKSLGGSLALSPRADGLELSVLLPGLAGHAQAESRPSHRGHILFIDDDAAITKLVCKQLSSAGYIVTAVSDSDEGLRRFSQTPSEFDCVVTDLLMPGLSGQTLALRIRELRPEVPVLLCSGNCDLGKLDASSTHCFAGFIPKPFCKRELTQAVSMALAQPATSLDERDKE